MNFLRVQTYGASYEVPYDVLAPCEELREFLTPEMAVPPAAGQPLHVLRLPMWPTQVESYFVQQTYVENLEVSQGEPAEDHVAQAAPTPDEVLTQLLADIRRRSRQITWFRCGPNYTRLMQILAAARQEIVRTAVGNDWMRYGVSIHDLVDAIGHQHSTVARRLLSRFVVAAGEEAAMALLAIMASAVSGSFR